MRLRELAPVPLEHLLQSAERVLIHFGTDWCAPCKRLERVVQAVAVLEGFPCQVGKVNVEDYPELAGSHGVTKSPTLCLFIQGRLVARHEGFLDQPALLAFVGSYTD